MGEIFNNKLFLSADELRSKSWQLAEKVLKDFSPEYLIAIWRGGSVIGMYLHEYFKAAGLSLGHSPLKAASYIGIQERKEVELEGFEHIQEKLKNRGIKRILLVDDVFESGNTMKAIKEKLPDVDVRIATPYWKEDANETDIVPDYYVENLSKKLWIVFPHELQGLNKEEVFFKGVVKSIKQ